MNLKLIFRIFGGLNMLTGAGALFATDAMLSSAGMLVTPQLITVGQGFGVTAIAFGLVAWGTAEIAGNSLSEFGKLYGIAQILLIALIVFHLITGQAGGPPVYVNLGDGAILAVLFFLNSK